MGKKEIKISEYYTLIYCPEENNFVLWHCNKCIDVWSSLIAIELAEAILSIKKGVKK